MPLEAATLVLFAAKPDETAVRFAVVAACANEVAAIGIAVVIAPALVDWAAEAAAIVTTVVSDAVAEA